jgi:hypothetical protein
LLDLVKVSLQLSGEIMCLCDLLCRLSLRYLGVPRFPRNQQYRRSLRYLLVMQCLKCLRNLNNLLSPSNWLSQQLNIRHRGQERRFRR